MNGLTPAEVSELLFSGFTYYECREVVEAAADYKLSRLLVTRGKASVLIALAARKGMHTAVSDFDVIEGDTPEGKGAWINTGKRAADSGGLCFVYVGRRGSQVRQAWASDAGGEEPYALGEFFRIPRCCTDFYCAQASTARAKHDNDYAELVTLNSGASRAFPWETNYLAQYFGHGLIHHFPCSWQCAASVTRARDSLDLIAGVSPSWAALTREMSVGTVFFAGRRGVHMIRGWGWSDSDRYRADQVVSTTYNELSAALKSFAGRDARKELPHRLCQSGGSAITPLEFR